MKAAALDKSGQAAAPRLTTRSGPRSPTVSRLGNLDAQRLAAQPHSHNTVRIGRITDSQEVEADRVAESVLRAVTSQSGSDGEDVAPSSRSSDSASGSATAGVFGTRAGRALDPTSRTFFEPHFGDLSHVRIHDDANAASVAASIGARAYTAGSHIGFAAGEFAPDADAGRKLLAHELAHVAQGGAVVRRQPAVQTVDDEALVSRAITEAEQVSRATNEEGQVSGSPAEEAQVSWPITAEGVPNMSDTVVQSELYEASRNLSRIDLADREAARKERDLLEKEAFKRGLAKAVPGSGANEFTIEGFTFSEDPEHVRYVLETLVAEKGTSTTARIVRRIGQLTVPFIQDLETVSAATSLRNLVEPVAMPTFPTPALAAVVEQQWGFLKAENAQIIKKATLFGNELMTKALAASWEETEKENRRYAWSSQPRGYTARQMHNKEKLAEEQRLGQAAKVLVAKKAVLSKATGDIASVQWQMNSVSESDMNAIEHLSSQISRLEPVRDQARQDLLEAELAYAKEFPVLSSYLSRNDWNGLEEIADDPTEWHYGGRIKETLTNIVEVQDALKDGDTSCWKQDRIVDVMRNFYSVRDGSMLSKLFEEAVAEANDDPWWKKALTFVAIGLSLLAAIPTGGGSLAVTAILTLEVAAVSLDLYLLHDAYSKYELEKAATGTDFDVARSLSSVEPSLFWLAVQVVATGIGAGGAARSFGQILKARAALRAASSSDELVSSIKALDSELEQAGVSGASRERAIAESMPPRTADEIVQGAAEAGIRVSDDVAEAAAKIYPGARPHLVTRPSNAPLEGTSWAGTTQKWKHRHVSMEEIQPATDALGERYWRFPDLADGEVLVFPSGYRVWKQPHTGAIVEEAVVGPSVSAMRSATKGEEAIFTAKDTSAAHAAAGTQRAHGAGAPGLGFDAPYGVVHAPKGVNLGFENAGVERWVRELRDAAPPGVEFVYQTTTIKNAMNLQQRVYKISAIADGQIHEMYQFTLRMKPGGLGDDALEFLADETQVFSAAERFTAPVSASKTATAGKATHVEPPPKLREALGRPKKVAKDVPHRTLSSTLERLTSLKNTMMEKLEKLRFKSVSKKLSKAGADRAMKWSDALDELGTKVSDLETHLATAAVDPSRLDAIATAVIAFNRRAARWPEKVTRSQIREFTRQLDEFLH
jgi:hypothetical protein